MTTKFDVEDEVAVKGIVTTVKKDLTGKIIYRVKLCNVNKMFGFIEAEECDVIAIKEDKENGSETERLSEGN